MQIGLGSKILAQDNAGSMSISTQKLLVNKWNIPVILCLDEEFFYHVHVLGPNISVQTSPKSRGGK